MKKSAFDYIVGLVSIASGVISIAGFFSVMRMVIEVHPIVQDMQPIIQEIKNRTDTVVVREAVARIDTVYVTRHDTMYVRVPVPTASTEPARPDRAAKPAPTEPTRAVSEQEEEQIRSKEQSFRERHADLFKNN